ncbi:MAG: TonB-dependent receptor [Gemmatimonadota bacterium]
MRAFVVRFPTFLVLLAAAVAVSLYATPLAAQDGAVAGTVKDTKTGAALSTVQVEIRGADDAVVAGDFTGSAGTYRIAVPAGVYSVTFTSPGWDILTEAGVTVAAGQTTTVGVDLVERAFNLNPITVTASKHEEKVLDAPAAVQVVSSEDIREANAITSTDHVKDQAGVDVISTGLQSNYVVARGFNNIFSGATLTLTDNRIARIPSLRANITWLDPITNWDLDRIEVVLGPGSALYGPNAANGVIHSITRSPIDDPGVDVSVSTGIRNQGSEGTLASSSESLTLVEARLAARTADEKFGFKVSGQYFQGMDWETNLELRDPVEAQQLQLAQACVAASPNSTTINPLDPACLNFTNGLDIGDLNQQVLARTFVDNVARGRDYDLERWSIDGRFDIRPKEGTSIIVNGGYTNALNSVDFTGLGAGQVDNWAYYYVQGRLQIDDFFAQAFFNKSDNEDTFLLRSGRPLVDKSKIFVAQLQHAAALGENQRFVYGADLISTRPDTDGTINGQNDVDDDVTEVGGYVQSETALSPMWDLVLAARVDHHTALDDLVFSPRAALVYKPSQENSIRLTYNRAFSTPTSLNLFLDISGGTVPLGGPFRYDLRAQGVTENGLQMLRDDNGVPQHQSPFNVLLGGANNAFLPTTTGQLWAEAVAVVSAQDPAAGGLLGLIAPPGDADVPVVAATLDPFSQTFDPVLTPLSEISDIDVLKPTITQTIEFGYKGLISGRLLLGINGYWSHISDNVSALRLVTPNVFLEGSSLGAYLTQQFRGLVGLAFPNEPTADATAAALAGTIATVPLGVITPGQAGGSDATLIVTYQNIGSLNLGGGDISFTYLASDYWEIAVGAAFVSDEAFTAGSEIISLNAPTAKGSVGVRYRNADNGWSGRVRSRFQDGYEANSGVFVGSVEGFGVVDLGLGYTFPRSGVTAQLDIQNALDNNYASFVGAPALGRVATVRLSYSH